MKEIISRIDKVIERLDVIIGDVQNAAIKEMLELDKGFDEDIDKMLKDKNYEAILALVQVEANIPLKNRAIALGKLMKGVRERKKRITDEKEFNDLLDIQHAAWQELQWLKMQAYGIKA